jgi:hypothetical protein
MGKGKKNVKIMYKICESQVHSMYHFVFANFITVYPYIILITNTDITHSHDKYKIINNNSSIRFRILRAIQNSFEYSRSFIRFS